MLTLLAQSMPSATEITSWLSVLMYLGGFVCTVLGGAVCIKQLRKPDKQHLHVSPSPLEVSAAPAYVTKDEHRKLEAEVAKIDGERRTSVANLHNKIDENTRMTAQHGGKLDLINQTLHQIQTHLLNQTNRK